MKIATFRLYIIYVARANELHTLLILPFMTLLGYSLTIYGLAQRKKWCLLIAIVFEVNIFQESYSFESKKIFVSEYYEFCILCNRLCAHNLRFSSSKWTRKWHKMFNIVAEQRARMWHFYARHLPFSIFLLFMRCPSLIYRLYMSIIEAIKLSNANVAKRKSR